MLWMIWCGMTLRPRAGFVAFLILINVQKMSMAKDVVHIFATTQPSLLQFQGGATAPIGDIVAIEKEKKNRAS